mmetsp:Transcript_36223/g.116326  ORF Transcript_36223/g.116326 Transcript_36223/m.116326 type:complete len:292 (-) Transcript_36223:213-1088(-)
MVHELGARAAGLGLILEAILHEGDLVLVPLREALLEALDGGDILGHLDADEERVGPKHLHQPGRQVAEAPHDVEELVNVRLPREEGRARCHLRQHAADGPNVHRLAVRRVTGEQLGATVPARRDVVGVTRAGARERAREPKVAKLQRAVARDQQVLWFDVTMDHVVGVAVFDRAQQLPQALLGLERIHAIRVPLEVLENRPLNKLKDEVQLALAPEYLNQVDDVIVFKLLEDPDLAQRRLPDLFVLIRLFELLDRHNLSSLLVACLDDNAVRPFADGAQRLVVLHCTQVQV